MPKGAFPICSGDPNERPRKPTMRAESYTWMMEKKNPESNQLLSHKRFKMNLLLLGCIYTGTLSHNTSTCVYVNMCICKYIMYIGKSI